MSMRMRVVLLCVLAGSVAGAQSHTLPELRQAADAITPEHLLRHIRELSSDAYAGRFPGTPGETKSVAWLIAQAKEIGLAPGTPSGTWIQSVPLVGTRSRGTLTFSAKGKTLEAIAGQDVAVSSNLPESHIEVTNAGLVFVGYGAVAPEYDWDDYAGIDVTGKTVVILTGDPPVTDPDNPGKLHPKRFLGEALTIHGRAGTKQSTAFQHGAAAILTVNPAQTGTLNQGSPRENMTLRDGRERLQVRAQAQLTTAKATEVFAAAGADFRALAAAAAKPSFRAVPLDANVTIAVDNEVRPFESQNVVARIDGSDPRLKNEYVVYTGHWDHHGQEGDQIFHGASDNAAGTAGVLELARAFKTLRPAPKRTLIFLWPTAEEKGLLGARWYVDHPLYPLAATVANINLDYFSNWGWGRTSDFSIVGLGNSTLDDLTADAVARQGRTLTGDTAPEQGFFFRSDHLEFTRVGVPALETSPGIDYIGQPAGYGVQKRTEYIRNDYHKVSDVVKPDWDLSGAVEDLQILLEVGYRVAQQAERPAWKADAVWRAQAR